MFSQKVKYYRFEINFVTQDCGKRENDGDIFHKYKGRFHIHTLHFLELS